MKKYNIMPSCISFMETGFDIKATRHGFSSNSISSKHAPMYIYLAYRNDKYRRCKNNPQENV